MQVSQTKQQTGLYMFPVSVDCSMLGADTVLAKLLCLKKGFILKENVQLHLAMPGARKCM